MNFAFFDTKSYDKPAFEKYGLENNINFRYFETKLNLDTVKLAKGFDGVCIFVNDVCDSKVIDKLVSFGVKAIALRCAGYNNVDLGYAKGKIAVFNVPVYSPYAVAEHTMALLLTVVRKTHKAYIRTRDFNFSLSGLTGFDLHGKTIGVIGTGRIGKTFINICKGFGMEVLAYDKYPDEKSHINYVPLEKIFRDSDIISLHCPLTEETRHIIDENAINDCKNGVIILNTSRGGLIDAEALIKGIKSKKIGGAGLDVYEEESDVFFKDCSDMVMTDDILARLISMPNVIVSSHQAFLTNEALNNIAQTTVNNIKEYFEKGKCENLLVK